VHLHLSHPHLPLPAVLLSAVYTAAIVVAIANPGLPTLGGLCVLAGLAVRWVAYSRHACRARLPAVGDAAPAPEPAPAQAAVA
jgi:uncharacterized membrane protein